jgi:uncharacterized membrane protein (UPF0127 family)
MASFLSPLARAPQNRFLLRSSRFASPLATRVETASDSATRRRGLLGRTSFEEGSALILVPCNGIHTFFMHMAIDVVFVSRSGEVLKTCTTMMPWRLACAAGAFAAIELPSGTIERTAIRRGDRLLLASH